MSLLELILNHKKQKFPKLLLSSGFFGGLVGQFMKFRLPLAKHVLAPLVLTATPSVTNAGIQKNVFHQRDIRLVISNDK